MDLKAYSQNISNFIAGSYITSAITLGKELGLFDELDRLDEPVSSHQLADACDLKERYVREWLGCMVSTRIVSLDDSDKYYIPQSLKPGLDAIGSAFLFPVIGTLTDKVKSCFKKDGPRGYGWNEMPNTLIDVTEDKITDPDKVVEQLLVPVSDSLESMTTILDLGCGVGAITRALSRRFPEAEIYGVDYTEAAITDAQAVTEPQSITNVTFVKEDATSLPANWTQKFDWVILFDVLHDLPNHVNVMKEVYRVLKNDGFVSISDPDMHSNHRDNIGDVNVAGVEYAISSVICLPCSMSVDGAPGLGCGWGIENKETFLTSSGWQVKDKRSIHGSYALNFTCLKAFKET